MSRMYVFAVALFSVAASGPLAAAGIHSFSQAKAAGVKRIRIHDLRHSHISLLIDMGFSAVAIADRVGHESIEITYQYAHLFPSKQTVMAKRLDDLGKGDFENVS